MKNFSGKKIAVLGLGLEGRDVTWFLLESKANVWLYDQKREEELDFSGIDKKKINLVWGEDYLAQGLLGFDTIFRSPGIYRFIPQLIEAEKKGAEITSATKLFFELCPAKIIGVTGTKGKGTTSTLIYEILKKTGKDVYLAGNIGKPYLELLPKLTKNSWVVLELSSFQLIDLTASPHIAVVLNVTIDHLDWHVSRKEYVDAKKNIVRFQKKTDFAVINKDYQTPLSFAEETRGKVFFFAKKSKVPGSYVDSGKIFLGNGKTELIGETEDLLLRGEHNWENITAAICASHLAGADIDSIKKTVFSFKGLEHRLELVGNINGVSFYNDSFSTNPQPTIAAINSFSEDITLILGGSDKGLAYDEMADEISRRKNVKAVILIGQIADKIKKSFAKTNFGGPVINLGMTNIEKVVKTAFKNTSQGGVVLLSPATASFGMFKDYKDRGEQFKKAVKKL